jgi:septum formation protein
VSSNAPTAEHVNTHTKSVHLILGSGSPRRAELLRASGFAFDVEAANIDETPRAGEPPAAYTQRVARDKARHVAASHAGENVVVLGADTEVVLGRRVLGKPADEEDARRMLRTLAGQVHEVLTAVILLGSGREAAEVVTTRVWFTPMTADEIDWYVASGEPMDKAGAYAIQGLGARFVERIEGSWSNVVGLPVAVVHRLLRAVQ